MSLLNVSVGARGSPLSRAQIEEVLQELRLYHPECSFQPFWVETIGDKDQKTSLKTLGNTDFFTKEIDEAQSAGHFRISIHSAKDLPAPLKQGLTVAALTKGLDPEDVLVIRDHLPKNPIIATSSIRREFEIRRCYPDAQIVDIRGNIGQRLAILDSKEVDGVVMAKCALMRLGITDRPCIALDGEVHPLQGRLAVIARADDDEMLKLFSCIDHRPSLLYLGLEMPSYIDKKVVHCPLIDTVPLEPDFPDLHRFTHVLLTSKMAVQYFMKQVGDARHMQFISVGKKTTEALHSYGCYNVLTAEDECQEGVIALISKLSDPCIFWPHSSRSRNLLHEYCSYSVPLYQTHFKKPIDVDFDAIDEIYFSSPSTVDAFFHFFGPPPEGKILLTQGKITQAYLQEVQYGNARKASTASL